jgi:predicted lipid carrier protein YhbT
MVKKHSNSIGKTVVAVDHEDYASNDVEFDPRFWHDVFDLYFVRGKESRGRQDDDLLFFVRKLVTK